MGKNVNESKKDCVAPNVDLKISLQNLSLFHLNSDIFVYWWNNFLDSPKIS